MSKLFSWLSYTFFVFISIPTIHAQTFQDASTLLPPANNLVGIGGSLVDVNSDGLVDIYRTGMLNMQQPDGSFINQLESLGIDEGGGIVFGSLFGDYNEDGFLDLFLMNLIAPSLLYQSRAGIGFTATNDQTNIVDQQLVQGSLWADIDNNGLIDLFVGIDGGISNLFLQQEDHTFIMKNTDAGFEYQLTYGVAAADYDQDGDPDIFLTQCVTNEGIIENVLLKQENGVFQNVSAEVGITDDLSSWATVWLDYNNDGWLDIFTANQISPIRSGTNTLYRNNQGLNFTDVSLEAGVTDAEGDDTIAASAADFDNDGWIDLFVATRTGTPGKLYRNLGDGTFEDVTASMGITPVFSQAVIVGDVNSDGWIDIFLPTNARDQLLLNEGGENHYLMVHARGKEANLFGIGARVEVYAGGMQQVREITAGDGMTSQNHNLSAHFGLGVNTMVDSLIVRWPGGGIERLEMIESDQEITVVQGEGINNPPGLVELVAPLSQVVSNADNSTLFTWTTATDPEFDALTYSLHIVGAELDTTFANLDSLSLLVSHDLFQENERYRWAVSVSDGHSERSVLHQEFQFGVPVSNESPEDSTPVGGLAGAFPNPFVSSVLLSYEVQQAGPVRIAIFDMLGHEIARLVNHVHAPGLYDISWDGRTSGSVSASPGVYFVQMTASDYRSTRMIIRR